MLWPVLHGGRGTREGGGRLEGWVGWGDGDCSYSDEDEDDDAYWWGE